MGRKKFRNEERIVRLCKKYKELTNDYSKFSEETFVEHPQLLLIVRLACGMPQRAFSKAIEFDRSALVHSELGISKRMKTRNARKIYAKILTLIQQSNFSEDNILENYRKFLHQASHGQPPKNLRIFGRLALKHKKPTEQEMKISKILDKLRIQYEKEGILTLDGMDFIFEFLIPSSKNPKAIIECKHAETKNKRNLKIVGYRIAYETGYKSYLIHKNFPKTKVIVLIDHNQENLPERVIKILKNETDTLLINPNESEITSVLKINV